MPKITTFSTYHRPTNTHSETPGPLGVNDSASPESSKLPPSTPSSLGLNDLGAPLPFAAPLPYPNVSALVSQGSSIKPSQVMCPHGGQVQFLSEDLHDNLIVGCPFMEGHLSSPCIKVTWQDSTPTLLSRGICGNEKGIAQGLPLVLRGLPKFRERAPELPATPPKASSPPPPPPKEDPNEEVAPAQAAVFQQAAEQGAPFCEQ